MWKRFTLTLTTAIIFLLLSTPGFSYTSSTDIVMAQTHNLQIFSGDITEVLSLALTPSLVCNPDSGRRGGGGALFERKNICSTSAKKACQVKSSPSLTFFVTLFKHYYFLNDISSLEVRKVHRHHRQARHLWHFAPHPRLARRSQRLDRAACRAYHRQTQCQSRLLDKQRAPSISLGLRPHGRAPPPRPWHASILSQ